MSELYDFVIIGSGASGSVLAYNLAKAGASCVMLEAGREYSAKTFPRNELLANSSLYWGGGMDATTDASLLFLRGKVLGGGTVVNQALLDRFDDIALDDWRDKSGVEVFNTERMARYYDSVEAHLHLHQISRDEWNRNGQLYVEGFEKCGYRWGELRRGQSNCDVANNDCITCLGGCRRNSKQSMLITFLAKAREAGLKVISEFNVDGIVHGKHLVSVHGKHQGNKQVIQGRRCIVAAGTLGTNGIMLRSGFGRRLPALGTNFFSHPQWMNIALFDERVDAHKGGLQSVKSDEPRFRQAGFKLENVFAGPIAVSMLNPAHGPAHQDYMKEYRQMASIEVCIRDVVPGRIRVNHSGRLRISKPIEGEDLKRGMAGVRVVRELFESVGAYRVITSNFNFSLHQMGGCAIGQSAARSVVNEGFQVHGLENLYIADGSIFPSAPGINPSLTIMANSQRAAELILTECGEQLQREQEVAHG